MGGKMKISDQMHQLIYEANKLNASDIHFHPVENQVKIYYRIVDKLVFQKEIQLHLYVKMLRFIKFRTRLDISITKFPQDGAFNIKTEIGEKIYIRVSTIPLMDSESLVIRLLPDECFNTFEEIAFNQNDLSLMYEQLRNKNGLFIFTGPTGSGKTTSMYSILAKLAVVDYKKILTLENPIEIIDENFVQMQINEEMNITYTVGLKAALRQDPDIIMIGEIRDEETARNVFRAALTGHTVISTMHTKNKYGVIERLLDFGFLPSEIESVLIGVSNQRLVVDKYGLSKSFYDYALSDELSELISTKGRGDTIEDKIDKLRQSGEIR